MRDLAQRQARQRSRALVPGRDLGTQGPLEQRPGGGVVLARQQELAPSLARFCFTTLIARLPVPEPRSGVQPVGLGEGVELHRQVGVRERDTGAYAGRRPGRIGETLSAPQAV